MGSSRDRFINILKTEGFEIFNEKSLKEIFNSNIKDNVNSGSNYKTEYHFKLLKPIGTFKKGKTFNSYDGLLSGISLSDGTSSSFEDKTMFEMIEIKVPLF